jgi:chromosome segregation ATPase
MENVNQSVGPDNVMQALSEAQLHAKEQRLAAERFLQETVALEQRLAEEAEAARRAGEYARRTELLAQLEEARSKEQEAAAQLDTCTRERVALENEIAELEKRLGEIKDAPWQATLHELRELETRRRIAERRAADMARGLAS